MGSNDILSTVRKTIKFYHDELIPNVKNYDEEGQEILKQIISFWYFEPTLAYEKTLNLVIENNQFVNPELALVIRDFYDKGLGIKKSKYGQLTFQVIANLTLYLYSLVQDKAYDIIAELIDEYKHLINPNARSKELIVYLAGLDYDNIISKIMEEDKEKTKSYSYV